MDDLNVAIKRCPFIDKNREYTRGRIGGAKAAWKIARKKIDKEWRERLGDALKKIQNEMDQAGGHAFHYRNGLLEAKKIIESAMKGEGK